MQKTTNWIILGIIVLAFILRLFQYAQFPVYGETQDEIAWTWIGTSILQGQQPTSWSGTNLNGYQNIQYITLHDQSYRVVTPYLDNPHLFSLIPGTAALLKGFRGIEIPSMSVIRFPMIILGTLNVWLLYLFAKKAFTPNVALLSTMLYATIPTFVFASRVVVAENLLITLMLLSGLLLAGITKKPTSQQVLLLGILGGVSILTKVAGAVIPISIFILLLSQKHTKQAFMSLILAILIGSMYPIYGFLVNAPLFLQVLAKQSDFGIGIGTLISLFIRPQLVQKTLMDGWVYLGMFSLFFSMSLSQKLTGLKILSVFSLMWLIFLLAATPEVSGHGWYRYPLFPLISISLALLIRQFKDRPFFATILALLVVFPLLRLVVASQDIHLPKFILRGIIALAALPAIIRLVINKPRLGNQMTYATLVIAVALNILLIFLFTNITYWEDSLYFFPVRSSL